MATTTLNSDEPVCIVNEQNEVVGKADRIVMRTFNLPHRSTFVVIRNSAGLYYVQRRTKIKDYCPGMLDPMTGGVVQFGESYEENAYRETKEEMGIEGVELLKLEVFYYGDERSRVWGGMFECTYDGEVTPQPEEVDEVLLLSENEIKARANEFTPDGMWALQRYLNLRAKGQ